MLVAPAKKPSAVADPCWVSARSFDACCGRRSKPGHEGPSSSPNPWEGAVVSPRLSSGCCGRRSSGGRIDHIASPTQEAEAPPQGQELLQLQEVHHCWFHHLQVDSYLSHWTGSALCFLIWGAR